MKSESILQEAQRIVHSERGADYGHPLDDFAKTAKLWQVVLNTSVTPEQVALCMCMVKISRELNRHKRDNLTDLCGYAETYMMVKEERDRREIAVQTFGPLEEPTAPAPSSLCDTCRHVSRIVAGTPCRPCLDTPGRPNWEAK